MVEGNSERREVRRPGVMELVEGDGERMEVRVAGKGL